MELDPDYETYVTVELHQDRYGGVNVLVAAQKFEAPWVGERAL